MGKGKPESQTSRKQAPALISVFPEEKADQALERIQEQQGLWTPPGEEGFRWGGARKLL